MKNVNQIFKNNTHLMDQPEVIELIEYCQELEGEVLEKKIDNTYNKEHMLKTMLSDILSSCREYEENKILKDRYPELYNELDANSLVKNLMEYIITMNNKNNLRL
jgi:hypothetical protein